MDHADYIAAIGRDGPALLDAARAADPDAAIVGCPDWKPVDLVWHIGEVHHFWAAVVQQGMLDPAREYVEPSRPAGRDDVDAFADDARRRLVAALEAADPATEVWTWAAQRDVAFVARRMAHETAMHRWDAARAGGHEYVMAPELAADGIDEFLEFFLPAAGPVAPPFVGSVHIHCADVAGEWTVRAGDDGRFAVTRDHTKADAALRGDAADLLSVLWRRVPLEAVTLFGEQQVAERFVAHARLS